MTEPFKRAIQPDHAAHDAMWMAALAARDPDLAPSEMARAQAALESCGQCADLFADLVAVAAAIPTAAIPPRSRDFTLTAADAARLRSRGIRRWFAAIGSARDGVTFPLAMGLTTLGIAGLLLATLPGLSFGLGGAASAPMVLSTVGNAVGQAAPDASAAAPAPAAAPSAAAPSAAASAAAGAAESTDTYAAISAAPSGDASGEGVFSGDGGDGATGSVERQGAQDLNADGSIGNDSTGFSALAVVAGLLLILGLALFALRWSSRRL
jgi:hypothetical protein